MSMDFSDERAQPFELEAGENALLLIHGFTGSPGHMRIIGDAVHQAGFSVRGILLPGHGTSIEDMARSDDKQWREAAETAFAEMKRKYKRVSVGGLSMGGILTALIAEKFDPACVIFFAPALKYKRWTNLLSQVAKHFIKVLDWGGRQLSPETFRYDYDYGYTGTPVAKVEDMTRLQREARANLPGITCPAQVFQSHQDGSVHASVPDLIMRSVSSQVKEICWVDRSPHVLTLGPDRDYVCDRVIDFMRRYGV